MLEIAERATDRWDVVWTDFLTPPIVADSMAALQGRQDVICVPWGGYAQAERCRCGPAQALAQEPAKLQVDPQGDLRALNLGHDGCAPAHGRAPMGFAHAS